MITLKRTQSTDADFITLIRELDKDLNLRYGEVQATYAPLNKVDDIPHTVVVYHHDVPAGCGCFKKYDEITVELKRVFVQPEIRNKGIATAVVSELEKWAREDGFTRMILETGTKQTEAIELYKKLGYGAIDLFGPYVGMEYSYCFGKVL